MAVLTAQEAKRKQLRLRIRQQQLLEMLAAGSGHVSNPIPGLSPAAYYKFNTGITQAGGFVSQWADQSGNARHLLQATGANQPAVDGSGIITFDGDFLAATFSVGQPIFIGMLVKPITWAVNTYFCDGANGDSVVMDMDNASGTGISPNLTQYSGTYGGQDLTHNTVGVYHSVFGSFNGASSFVRVDSNANASGNAGANGLTKLTIGAAGSGLAAVNAAYKEFVVLSAIPTAAQIDQIAAYWATL